VRSRRLLPAGLLLLLLSANCSEEGQTATIKVRNARATQADVQLVSTTGSTLTISAVQAGTVTGVLDLEPGTYAVTATILGETVSPTTTFTAQEGAPHIVVVLATSPPSLQAGLCNSIPALNC